MLIFELILPAYNEEQNLPALVERAVAAAQTHQHEPATFQLVLVENGSSDGSARVLDDLKSGPLGAWFRVVPVVQNRGYGFGLWQGLQTTTAPFVAYSHADQQCDPMDAFAALAIVRGRAEEKLLVKGARFGRNWKDRLVTRVFEGLGRLILGVRSHEFNAQPKVFARRLLAELKDPPNTFAFDLYLLYCAQRAGYRLETIPVEFPPRIHGASKWASNFASRWKTIGKMVLYMLELGWREGRL